VDYKITSAHLSITTDLKNKPEQT